VWQRDNIEKAALIVAFIVVATAILREASESRWKKFTSAEGAFSVLMPGKPQAENQLLTLNGMKLEAHAFSVQSQTGAYFAISYVDAPTLPKETAGERMLDAQRQVLTQGDESRMLSAENLIVNGYPVRQYKAIVKGNSQADEKLFLVRRRLYILLVVHDKGEDEDDVNQFFGSFTFKPTE
jgi:hypothetical protein